VLRTPLADYHAQHDAQMVDFAGWSMPIRYTSIIEEHNRVRTSGGLFDVSHMGRLRIKGRHARRFLERLCTRRISDMQPGQCRYSLVCNEQGGVRDDILVYRLDDDLFQLVVNASNREKILEHIESIKDDLRFTLDDKTLSTAMIALQGPAVMDLVGAVSSEVPTLKRYRFIEKNLMVMKLMISRTGYTGEDGVEVILPAKMVNMALKMLNSQPGADKILAPVGLGARDTLRLEAGMPLYGHELGEDIPALASGLSFAINLDKDSEPNTPPCIGIEALRQQAQQQTPTTLVGIALKGKRSARQGMPVLHDGASIGIVTSACLSPTLGHPIAMAYVDRQHAAQGTPVTIDTSKTMLEGQLAPLPFYKAPKK
jgi:glycine cleavage system T protein (aminomethyltransferase)